MSTVCEVVKVVYDIAVMYGNEGVEECCALDSEADASPSPSLMV